MTVDGFALFPTAIGDVGVAWRGAVVTAVQLPGSNPDETARRLSAKAHDAERADPPAWVASIGRAIAEHVAGRSHDFSTLPLAMDAVPPFHRRVYDALRAVPAGQTVTYGELAALAGSPRAVRAVGQAMAKNPFPLVVPCHRVLAANGRSGGFSAFGGIVTKADLLAREGAVTASWRVRPK